VRPLKAQQKPEHQEPDDQVPEVQENVAGDQAPFCSGNLTDIGVGHHALAAFLAVANRLALFRDKFALLGRFRHEARFLPVLVFDNDCLDQPFSVRSAPGLPLRVAILIAALAEFVQGIGNLFFVFNR
jgi:hypothetical protein